MPSATRTRNDRDVEQAILSVLLQNDGAILTEVESLLEDDDFVTSITR